MKYLSGIRNVLTWLCICPIEADASKVKRILRAIVPAAIILILTWFIIASVVFFTSNISVDVDNSLFALMQVIGTFGLIYLFCTGLLMCHKENAVFIELEEIHKKNENEDFYKYLARANETCENISRIYFKYIPIFNLISILGTSLVSVILCWMKADFTDLWRPSKVASPWNNETPLGFLLENALTVAVAISYIYVNGVFVLMFISVCLHHRAFYKVVRHSVKELEHHDGNRNPAEIICNMIRFQNSAKTFFMKSAEVYKPFTLITLISNMLFLACDLYMIDRQFGQPNSGMLLFLVFFGFNLLNLFIYCYFGKLATESYTKMGDCLYNSNWNRLSIDLQKWVPLIIQNTQRPLEYSGFGITVLKLETFTKLMKSLYSYYMMFKGIAMK